MGQDAESPDAILDATGEPVLWFQDGLEDVEDAVTQILEAVNGGSKEKQDLLVALDLALAPLAARLDHERRQERD